MAPTTTAAAPGGAPTPTVANVRVSPLVLAAAADAFTRRPDGAARVVGTLLGVASAETGLVDVRDCFVVPHSEANDTVAIDIPHHANLLALHTKVSPKETVVGWFSAGEPFPSAGDALIHDFYRREAAGAPGASTAPPPPPAPGAPPAPPTPSPSALPPVFVTIDAALSGPVERLPLSAFVGRALTLKGAPLATEFVEAPCEVVAAEVDRSPLGALLRGGDEASTASDAVAVAPGDAAALDATVDRLVSLLDAGAAYARRCADGSEPHPSPAAGRALSDALAALPALPPSELAALAADASQDALLVAYLAQLVRAQVALADRLGTAALPIL